jgi:predicted O-linked N-acetylglucosamine transferase (SPINDLY family)
VELGLNHSRRLGLGARLERAQLSCPLFNTQSWVRDLERLVLRMWDIDCSGAGPQSFEISSE